MIFLRGGASPSLARTGRIALIALGLAAGGAALSTLPMIGVAHADHGQGGGHDSGGHDGHDNGGPDHSGPGRGPEGHDDRGPGHDDAADHDANDDNGGVAGGADDPADHDADDDNGTNGAVLPATTTN